MVLNTSIEWNEKIYELFAEENLEHLFLAANQNIQFQQVRPPYEPPHKERPVVEFL